MIKVHTLLLVILVLCFSTSFLPDLTYAQQSAPAPPMVSPASPPAPSPEPSKVPGALPSPEGTASPENPAKDPLGFREGSSPIIVNGRTLFYLYADSPNLPRARRAMLISLEIQETLNKADFNPDKLRAVANEKANSCEIFYENRFLFSIFAADIPVPGVAPIYAGQRAISIIKLAGSEAAQNKIRLMRHNGLIFGLQGLAVLILFAIVTIFLTRGFRRMVESGKGKSIRALKAGNVELVSEAHLVRALFFIYRLFLLIIYVGLTLFYLNHLLGYFPEIAPLRAMLLAQPIIELKKLGIALLYYLPNLFFILICIYATRFALGVVDKIFDGIANHHLKTSDFYYEFREIFRRITRYMVYFFALVLIFPNLPGYDLPIFKGLSLAAAAIVSLGSSGFVANQLAGISLIASRAYKVGDWVKIGDHMGTVTEVALAFTRLQTNRNIDVILSNTQVLQKEVQNYSSAVTEKGGMGISTSITIGYDAHGDVVRDLCLKAVEATENIVREPRPVVLQRSLEDFYVSYEIWAFSDNPKAYIMTLSALNANIREFFDRAGVEIMSPHYKSLRDGTKTTIPERYLKTNAPKEAPQSDAGSEASPEGQAPPRGDEN
jgi:small-conductance mechanosensitive channel